MRDEDRTREPLIDRLPLAYIRMDADLRILDWNPAAEKIFGYPRAEALGCGCLELILPLPVPDAVQQIVRAIQAGNMHADDAAHSLTWPESLTECCPGKRRL